MPTAKKKKTKKKKNPGWRAVKKAVKKKLKKKKAAKKKRNPEISSRLVKRFMMFHEGDEPTEAVEVKINVPDELSDMGELVALTYRTQKCGKVHIWEHEFDKEPQLACGPDGKNIQIIGGSYTVTDRGIVG
jgi:hypothetical protein